MNHKIIDDLQDRISYRFRNEKLLRQSLTHPSCKSENRHIKDYQRLEYLGDAVLELVVSEYLLKQDKNADEGDLTKRRIQIVRAENLSEAARQINLQEHIRVGKGAAINDGILSDVVESLIGAVYSDGGLSAARQFIHRYILPINVENTDYKSMLQEILGNKCDELHYESVEVTGADNNRKFKEAAIWNGSEIGVGVGHSRKAAQQNAAKNVLERIHRPDAETCFPVSGSE